MDEVESAQEYYYASLGGRKAVERAGRKRPAAAMGNTLAASLRNAALSYIRETNGGPLSQWIRGLPEEGADILAQTILGEAALDDELASYKRLRLLIVQWSAYCLRSLGKRAGKK